MLTATDIAHAIVASRRAEADELALSTAVRLARRQQRLNNRIQRVEQRISGR